MTLVITNVTFKKLNLDQQTLHMIGGSTLQQKCGILVFPIVMKNSNYFET